MSLCVTVKMRALSLHLSVLGHYLKFNKNRNLCKNLIHSDDVKIKFLNN